MNKRLVIGILLGLWVLWLATYLLIDIRINGDRKVYLNPQEEYIDSGAKASFCNTRLSLTVTDNINTKVGGTYTVYYTARNPFGIAKKRKRTVIVRDKTKPIIELKGTKQVVLKQGEKYKEPGYQATDLENGNLTKKVKVTQHIDVNRPGKYTVQYAVTDTSGNKTVEERKVQVIAKIPTYQDRYDKIDNTEKGWGHGNKKDHKRPMGDVAPDIFRKYDAYAIGNDEPVLYLTFDEGSSDTYVKEILEVLAQEKVKATFFLCRNYMLENKEIVKKMVRDGHIVGNHTHRHKMMPTLATRTNFSEYLKEIQDTEKAYEEVTGKEMPKVYREPAGEWSYRSLAIMQDLGYRTYFWSAAYMDYGESVSKASAYQKMMQLYHNGAIYLLHPKNKGNYLALEDFIKSMKKLGYHFDTVDKIG